MIALIRRLLGIVEYGDCAEGGTHVSMPYPPRIGKGGLCLKCGALRAGEHTAALAGNYLELDTATAPANPASGKVRVYSLDGQTPEMRDSAGIATDLVSLGLFGDGSDGVATIATNTTLTRDMYYDDLTVNAGINLDPDGFRVFVRGTLTLNGTIRNDGSAGANGSNGASSNTLNTGPAGATSGKPRSGTTDGDGGRGGDGESWGTNGTGTDSAAGANRATAGGAAGGAGGDSCSHANDGDGSAAGSVTSVNVARDAFLMILAGVPSDGGNYDAFRGGSGGGGGGGGGSSGASAQGGAGGGGGGTLIIAAHNISGSGTIQANGGNDGNGGVGYDNGSLSHGGGGAGVGVAWCYLRLTTRPTLLPCKPMGDQVGALVVEDSLAPPTLARLGLPVQQ